WSRAADLERAGLRPRDGLHRAGRQLEHDVLAGHDLLDLTDHHLARDEDDGALIRGGDARVEESADDEREEATGATHEVLVLVSVRRDPAAPYARDAHRGNSAGICGAC